MRRFVLVLLVIGVLCACSKSSNGYGDGTEAAFMETCTVHEQQPQAMCSCIYEKITQQIPYDRYVELDKQMQTDDKFVPDELVRIAADCATPPTTTSTTTTTTAPLSTSSSSTSSSSSSSSSTVSPLGL
jgi:hypothetical protein